MTVKDRSNAIDRWKTTDIPVLLFSTVAATGMNLSEARIVIHLVGRKLSQTTKQLTLFF
jgi:SNF2 family DNA or RNA helicase